ncbi:hypothetical protein RhiJN_27791 [Ceratobasidium sp. AG-Ba]|nr:hypothetical protein RhiJN_27791 [Ceratobasidium sp. AG-Ba]
MEISTVYKNTSPTTQGSRRHRFTTFAARFGSEDCPTIVLMCSPFERLENPARRPGSQSLRHEAGLGLSTTAMIVGHDFLEGRPYPDTAVVPLGPLNMYRMYSALDVIATEVVHRSEILPTGYTFVKKRLSGGYLSLLGGQSFAHRSPS